MKRKRLFVLAAILIVSLVHSAVFAQSQQITNGLSYLTAIQNLDGSWGSATAGTEVLPSTVSAVEAFQSLSQSSTQNYSNALLWFHTQALGTTDYLSERIHTLSVAGSDDDLLISYLDDMTGAWGGDNSPDVDILDTAIAVQVLKKIIIQSKIICKLQFDIDIPNYIQV